MPLVRSQSALIHGFGRHWRRLLGLPRSAWLRMLCGLGLAIASLLGFAKLASEILEAETMQLDSAAVELLHRHNPDWLPGVMYFITTLGSFPTMAVLSLGTAAWLWLRHRNLRAIVLLAIASLGGMFLNAVLKLSLQRPRPMIDPLIDAQGFSLPSGHAMSALVFYGFLAYLLIRSSRHLFTKILIGLVLAAWIILIGITRIYLHAHYFTDVVAGYAAGCCWLSSCILAMEFRPWYRKHFSEPPGELPGDGISLDEPSSDFQV